jgi:hypothetical protein
VFLGTTWLIGDIGVKRNTSIPDLVIIIIEFRIRIFNETRNHGLFFVRCGVRLEKRRSFVLS